MVVLEFINETYYELDGKRKEIRDNKIYCVMRNIDQIIGDIPNNLKYLNLNSNGFTKFTQNLNQLKVLDLKNNQLTEFTQDLNKLEKLYLGYNLLTEFNQNLNQLKKLDLRNNSIIDLNNKVYNITNLREYKEYQEILNLQIRNKKIKSAR